VVSYAMQEEDTLPQPQQFGIFCFPNLVVWQLPRCFAKEKKRSISNSLPNFTCQSEKLGPRAGFLPRDEGLSARIFTRVVAPKHRRHLLRMLTYGVPADATDEYVRIGESTALESLRRFVAAVVDLFEDEYLRHPNEADTARLLALGERRGFPGMLGSIDCMHWAWKNCPVEHQGQYKGHVEKPTIILEAVASNGLWI